MAASSTTLPPSQRGAAQKRELPLGWWTYEMVASIHIRSFVLLHTSVSHPEDRHHPVPPFRWCQSAAAYPIVVSVTSRLRCRLSTNHSPSSTSLGPPSPSINHWPGSINYRRGPWFPLLTRWATSYVGPKYRVGYLAVEGPRAAWFIPDG